MSDPDLDLRADLPPADGPSIEQMLDAAREERVAGRLSEPDPTLWAPAGTPEVANRLGWLTIAERMLDELLEIERVADGVRSDGITDVVLLGMGGSSLAPEVFRRTFQAQVPAHPDAAHPGLRLHVLDSTDPAWIAAVGEAIDPARTLFVVSSKSGGTIEPLSLFAHFHSLQPDGSHFVAITDPGSGLAELATQNGFRHVFYGDPDIGGRYSALSPFGIVPATLMGVDTAALLQRSARAWKAGAPGAGDLPGAVWLGAVLAALARSGRDKLTFAIAPSLPGLGLWLEQLVAESTGKQGTGILPVAEEPLGDPGDYGSDRVFAHLPDPSAPDAAAEEALAALAAAGHPVITVPTSGPEDLGRVFLLAEIAVAVAGWGLRINPFDQPNVQQAKDATNRVLEGFEKSGKLPDVPAAGEAELRELLLGAVPPDYVALMGYLQADEAFDAAIAELRATVRAATRATTTFGYGPRFLHSTGQFHKGGPKVGRFLQLLYNGPADVEIPGRPYSFATLKEAQAIGDVETLRELGLPAQRVRLEGVDSVSALRALTTTIKGWT